ncbi:MAG: SEC-C domain-containing protein, partial [Clostridia bacterium]|nr:SEC-C domain-containing protein [Clostridia bacterium]
KGAVTIPTNMAGRGTDILLGGNPDFLAKQELRAREGGGSEVDDETYRRIWQKYKEITEAEHREVVALGGLHVIGTERHESRRIDNQLRGRSGRQGDPGSSRFYVSLEDDLMRLFGSESIAGILDRLGMDDSTPIDHPLVSRSLEGAQKKVEARNFDIRTHVLEYDDVLNQQRDVIYRERRRVLMGEDLSATIRDMIVEVIDRAVSLYSGGSPYPEEWDLEGLKEFMERNFRCDNLPEERIKSLTRDEVHGLLKEEAFRRYEEREKELGSDLMRQLERAILLRVVDEKWMDHLDAMDQLRQGIGLRAYGQRDPLVEYKFEAFQMFTDMIASIQEDVLRYLFRVQVVQSEPAARTRWVVENRYAEEHKGQPVRAGKKVGRNEPCPCGSGKKYKKCCGAA